MTATSHQHGHPIYGLMAELPSAEALVEAAHKVHEAGYKHVDAYTPYPIEEVAHALGHHRSKLPLIVLIGGLCGMVGGYLLQSWAAVLEYPLNIGGRPLATWPAFVIPSYELTILFAALTAAIGMIVMNGLPEPYHPVFNVDRFTLASSDKFFLVIEAADAHFGKDQTHSFLQGLGAKGVYDVAH
jgi:hypothetical protein